MRFLLCSLTSYGHLYPTIGLGKELQARGHDVALATGEKVADTLPEHGLLRIPRGHDDGMSFLTGRWAKTEAILAQVKHIQYARKIFDPDVLVGQMLTLGPMLVANLFDLPLAVMGQGAYLWPGSEAHKQSFTEPFAQRLQWRYDRSVQRLNEVRATMKLNAIDPPVDDTALVGDTFLLRSVPELEGDVENLPPQVRLVGACLWEPDNNASSVNDASDPDGLRQWLDAVDASTHPALYVQPGRSFYIDGFWPDLVETLGHTSVHVAATVGRSDEDVDTLPDNFFACDHIPQGAVLPHVDGVVASGHTTSVLGALSHGRPMFLLPKGSGSEDVSQRAEQAGAAVVEDLTSYTNASLKSGIDQLLNDTSLRKKAEHLQHVFDEAGGFPYAARLVESIGQSERTPAAA